MSQEKIYQTFASFGLTRTEARVYINLAKKGPQRAKELGNSLNMQKQQLYPRLKSLQSKGIVTAIGKRPSLFYAIPFENLLDLFTKANVEEAKRMIQNKKELLSNWQSMTPDNSRT